MSQELLAYLKDWLLPPGGLVLLLVLGLLLWRRVLGPWLIVIATIGLYLLSIPQTTGWLAAPLETDISADAKAIGDGGAQAVVVFLAGRTHKAPELGGNDGLSYLSLQRLHHAVRLHRQTGLPLVVSGGATSFDHPEGLALLATRALDQAYGIEPLLAEATSRSTWENATLTAALLREQGITRIALVTHAWHMPRARYSAESAGLSVIPAGTGFVSGRGGGIGQASDWLPSARALYTNRNLLHEHLGLWWYRYGRG